MSMADGKWVFIINPYAGNGFGQTYAPEVKRMIEKYQVSGEVVFTDKKGHATEIAREYVQKGFDHFIAVGGDGTVNEVMRALIQNPQVTFGVISAGTANDFIQILGFPDRFTDEDWEIFFQKNISKIDVGKCNENYFLNGMGLGFDAQVAADNFVDETGLKEGKGAKYLWHIMRNLLFFKELTMHTVINGEKTKSRCFINTISIGRRFAGKYFITPKALADDGLLDICMIRELNLLQRFRIFMMVPTGSHLRNANVNYYQSEKIVLEFDREVPHHLDGEIYYSSRFEVSVLPRHLNIIYNPTGPHYFGGTGSASETNE